MAFLTIKQVLDKLFSRIRDNSPGTRVRALGWLNSLMIDVVNERPWLFLNRSVTLAITANQITLPSDFSLESSILVNNQLLSPSDQIGAQDAFAADTQPMTDVLQGYTVEASTITFHPAATGNAVLYYSAQVPAAGYTDDDTATMFPLEFMPLFERALVTAFYEYDVDSERLPVSFSIDKTQMSRMKKLDNSRRSIPRVNPHGYVKELT